MRLFLLSSLISLIVIPASAYAAREFRELKDLPKELQERAESQSGNKEVPLDDFAGGVAGGTLAVLLGKGYTLTVNKGKKKEGG